MSNKFSIMSLQAFSEGIAKSHQWRILEAIKAEVVHYESEVSNVKTLVYEDDLDGNCRFELHLDCVLTPHDMEDVLKEVTAQYGIDLAVNAHETWCCECSEDNAHEQLFYVGPQAAVNQFNTDVRKWLSAGEDLAVDEDLFKRRLVAQMQDYKFFARYVGHLSGLLVSALHDYVKE